MPRHKVDELVRQLEHSELKRTRLQKRLAEKHLDEDGLQWSLADLMTLLVIFFILFFSDSVARVDAVEKTRAEPEVVVVETVEVEKIEDVVAEAIPAPVEVVKETDQVDPLEKLRREMLEEFKDDDQAFSMLWDDRRLILVLGEKVTFNAGEAKLLEGFKPVLERIAVRIASLENYQVEVSGHTDDRPISTPQFPSNWELSAARAVVVARFLIGAGVSPGNVSIQGYSEFRPVAPNDSEANRQVNRRVEIELVKDET